jgi:DNA invertase Pin-like site-specific DNA recombinase
MLNPKFRDKINAARQRGEDHYYSKLTQRGVEEIRKLYTPGVYGSVKKLAEKYNIDTCTIYRVVNRTAWGHIE